MKPLSLSSGKLDLIIDPPILNSAGMLGFTPDGRHPLDLSLMGGFIPHPLSLRQRLPARPSYTQPFPGGILLHTGLPNPGLRAAFRLHRASWHGYPKPIIAHWMLEDIDSLQGMVGVLEELDHPIQGLELGMADDVGREIAEFITLAMRSQLPLMARLSSSTSRDAAWAAVDAGVNALVIGPPRGAISNPGQPTMRGRLYGPGLFPASLQQLERMVQWFELPVLLGCGLFSAEQVLAAFDTGAAGVQLDTALWLDPGFILSELRKTSSWTTG